MTNVLFQAIGLLLLSALLIGGGGVVGQYGLEKWTEFRSFLKYKYRFFKGDPIEKTSKNSEEVRNFLNKLDMGKRAADREFTTRLKEHDITQLRRMNDYTFRVFRDLWFIQNEWYRRNGRFFQGKTTMPDPPNFNSDSEVKLGFGLTDQVDDWRDIGYDESYAPVQLESHVYDGPKGQGFTVWARLRVANKIWQNQMHIGPESHRDENNFAWVSN